MTTVIDIGNRQPREVGADFYIDADRVLEKAKGQLVDAFVLGIDRDGDVWLSGTHGHIENINYLLDRVKHYLLTGTFV